MKIIIDADASPVKDEVTTLAENYNLEVWLVHSFDHMSYKEQPAFVKTITVDPGFDSADFKILNIARKGDIIITQDYGLASLLLPKGCRVLHHKGKEYTADNIQGLLDQRHFSAQARKAGQRTKGPKALTDFDRKYFLQQLSRVIKENLEQEKNS